MRYNSSHTSLSSINSNESRNKDDSKYNTSRSFSPDSTIRAFSPTISLATALDLNLTPTLSPNTNYCETSSSNKHQYNQQQNNSKSLGVAFFKPEAKRNSYLNTVTDGYLNPPTQIRKKSSIKNQQKGLVTNQKVNTYDSSIVKPCWNCNSLEHISKNCPYSKSNNNSEKGDNDSINSSNSPKSITDTKISKILVKPSNIITSNLESNSSVTSLNDSKIISPTNYSNYNILFSPMHSELDKSSLPIKIHIQTCEERPIVNNNEVDVDNARSLFNKEETIKPTNVRNNNSVLNSNTSGVLKTSGILKNTSIINDVIIKSNNINNNSSNSSSSSSSQNSCNTNINILDSNSSNISEKPIIIGNQVNNKSKKNPKSNPITSINKMNVESIQTSIFWLIVFVFCFVLFSISDHGLSDVYRSNYLLDSNPWNSKQSKNSILRRINKHVIPVKKTSKYNPLSRIISYLLPTQLKKYDYSIQDNLLNISIPSPRDESITSVSELIFDIDGTSLFKSNTNLYGTLEFIIVLDNRQLVIPGGNSFNISLNGPLHLSCDLKDHGINVGLHEVAISIQLKLNNNNTIHNAVSHTLFYYIEKTGKYSGNEKDRSISDFTQLPFLVDIDKMLELQYIQQDLEKEKKEEERNKEKKIIKNSNYKIEKKVEKKIEKKVEKKVTSISIDSSIDKPVIAKSDPIPLKFDHYYPSLPPSSYPIAHPLLVIKEKDIEIEKKGKSVKTNSIKVGNKVTLKGIMILEPSDKSVVDENLFLVAEVETKYIGMKNVNIEIIFDGNNHEINEIVKSYVISEIGNLDASKRTKFKVELNGIEVGNHIVQLTVIETLPNKLTNVIAVDTIHITA